MQNQKPTNFIYEVNESLRLNHHVKLSELFSLEDLYLPGGTIFNIALAIKDIKTNQLRKIFENVEDAYQLALSDNFHKASETLFMIVPSVAYATGRNLIDPKDFNTFIQLMITPKRIQSNDDIITFFRIMQTVLAYKTNQ